MEKIKLEGSDIWENAPVPSEAEKAAWQNHADNLRNQVADWLIGNINHITEFILEQEDGSTPCDLRDIELAIATARVEELEKFLNSKNKALPYEDGFIKIIMRKRER